MSYMDEYNKLKKKRLEETKTYTKATNSGVSSYMNEYNRLRGQSSITTPLNSSITTSLNSFTRQPILLSKKEKDEETKSKKEESDKPWYKSGAFADGYDFGDIAKTILGVGKDKDKDTVSLTPAEKLEGLYTAYGKEDFTSKSGYVSTKADGFWDKLGSKYGMGYNDLQYEYINNQNGIRDEIDRKAISFGSDTGKTTSSYKEKALDYMTDDEVAVYNYYYQTEGKEKAQEFLDALAETLSARKAGKQFEGIKGKTGAEILYGVVAGDEQFKQGVKNLGNMIVGKDDYIPQTSTQILSGMIREDLADDGDGIKVFGNSLGQVGFDALSTGTNMIPSIALGAVNPVAGAALMGSSAAGNSYQEKLNEGYNKDAAGLYATTIGTLEGALQYALGGIGKLGGVSPAISRAVSGVKNGALRFALEYGGKITAEAFEEGLQEVLDPLVQNIILDADESIDWDAVGYSAFLGGLMGGTFGSSEVSQNHLSTNEQAVLDKVYKDAVAEKEKNGKLTTREKNKIYDDVVKQMERGYISTDTIESVLGGETYDGYQSMVEQETSLKEEIEALENTPETQFTVKQRERLTELREQLKGIDTKTAKSNLFSEVDKLTANDTKLRESYNEKARRGQAFEADLTKYDAKQQETIKKAVESGILNNTNRTHEFVDLVAKISADKGVLFDFTNNQKLKESGFAIDGKQVNGYVTKDGITLNVNSAKSLDTVVGHEITHVLEGTDLYTELQTAIVEYAKSKNDYQGRYDTLAKLYENVDGANIDSELTAELVGDYLFTDTDFINNLSTNNRNVFEKIYDEIKYLYKVATAGSKEARELERVKKLFDEAYRNGGQVQKNTADSGVKYSLGQYSDAQKENWKNSKKIVVYENDAQLLQFVKESIANKDAANKMLLGVINGDLAARIKADTGLDFEGKNAVIRAKNVRKILLHDHGDAEAESLRGQIAVTDTDFLAIKDVFGSPDDIRLEQGGYNGKPAATFEKVIGQKKYTMFVVDSGGSLDIFVQTMFIHKDKGSIANVANANALTSTPTATVGTAPNANIAQNNTIVKSQNSMDKDNVGYHAGDLGKSESLFQQGLGRDTGHFGTGTYFVGNKASLEGYNTRDGKSAPIEVVDFSQYNLFKPKNADDGFALHDFLRGVDGYWNRDADAVNTMQEYESLQEKLSDLVYDIESEEFGETDPAKESWMDVEKEFLHESKRMMGDYKVGKELTETLNRLVEGNYQYDPKNGEYYSYDFDTDQLTSYTEDEIIQKLNAEEGGWRAYEAIEKMADDYYSYRRTSRYETWSESIKDVANVLGVSEQEVRNIVQSVAEDINSQGYTDADMETADSAATRFMKALGYEGIDVRGIKGLDNTGYGSVIYDLKGEDLARKQEIGTARYSVSESDTAQVEEIPLEQRLSGDDLLDAQDMITEIEDVAEISPNGYVTVYHRTTEENAKRIMETGRMSAKEDGIFFSTQKDGEYSSDYGSSVVTLKVPVEKFVLDDIFDTEAHLRIPLKNRKEILDVSAYISVLPNVNLSLSKKDAIPTGKFLGKDIALETAPVAETTDTESVEPDVAPVSANAEATTSTDTNAVEDDIAPVAEKVVPSVLYNVRDGKNGWGNTYGTAQEALNDAVQFVNPELWNAFVEEFSNAPQNTALPRNSLPITDAVKAVQEDVRQEQITPIQGAQLLSETYKQGGKNALKVLYRTTDGNLQAEFLEKAKQYETPPSTSGVAPIAEANVEDYGRGESLEEQLAKADESVESLDAETEALFRDYAEQKISDEDFQTKWKDLDKRFTQAKQEQERLSAEMTDINNRKYESLDDSDIPPEAEAPYYGDTESIAPVDPFAERDMNEVGKRNVKAYMHDNPDVKPFFQDAARGMLYDLQNGTKGERIFNEQMHYESGYEKGWMGTSRRTTGDIADLLDNWGYTYAQIEAGLNAIIEGNGKENNAVSKRIEFMLDNRLRNGYKDVDGRPIPADDGYINLLKEKQIDADRSESFDSFMEVADRYAPPAEDIAPVKAEPTIEGEQNVLDEFEQTEQPQTEQAPERLTRAKLHSQIVDRIKSAFSQKGLDFDKVLKDAKRMHTVSINDNTPQRVNDKTFGYEAGEVLNDLTFNKVALNESEGVKWLNKQVETIRNLSKKYKIKPLSKESAAAQMYAEGFWVNKNDEIIAYGDAELAQDFPDVQVQNRIKALANDPTIRKIYDDTLSAINESRTRNAYPEIPRLENYYLHFRAMDDTFSRLGVPFNPNDIKARDLPTDVNGTTIDRKPGQPFFTSAFHREGKRTSFDLLGGVEKYLNSAKNQIYHIDDIQTARALWGYIADRYGQAHGLENLNELELEAQREHIQDVYDGHLSTYARFLVEYANNLAGKTAIVDRAFDGEFGRRALQFINTVNTQTSRNQVGYSISSPLTNFIPSMEAIARTSKRDSIKAFAQTVSNVFRKDGFVENDPTLIRRKGADKFSKTLWEKMSDPGFILMGAVDSVTSEFIVRTKYNELTRKGMDSKQAHIKAGEWASRIMGDRSYGQMPLHYNSKMLGLFTKYQLEVRNTLDSQFYDTYQEAKASTKDVENQKARNAKTAAKYAYKAVQIAALNHLFGMAFQKIAGYNPAFDIVSAIIKLFGWDDDEEDEDTLVDNSVQAGLELLGDLPYTNLVLDGGRIPAASALPIAELVNGVDKYGNEKSRLETIAEAAPYYILPGGYSQIKKTASGLGMFSEEHPVSGSYTDSGNLRFPVEKTFGNVLQAGLFGQYASENARDYFDNERSPLKEKQIQEYIDVELPIKDYWDYREGLAKQDTLEEKFDYIAGLDLPVEKKNILINNIVDRKEKVDLEGYEDFSDYEEFDFAIKHPEKWEFMQANNISYTDYNASKESREAYNWAAENPEKYVVSKAVADDVVTYRQYASELYDIRADKDSNGKTISGSAKNKKIAYIESLPLDYGQKVILFKSQYKSDDSVNMDIIEYLDSREDIDYEDMVTILTELGFTVNGNNVYWD